MPGRRACSRRSVVGQQDEAVRQWREGPTVERDDVARIERGGQARAPQPGIGAQPRVEAPQGTPFALAAVPVVLLEIHDLVADEVVGVGVAPHAVHVAVAPLLEHRPARGIRIPLILCHFATEVMKRGVEAIKRRYTLLVHLVEFRLLVPQTLAVEQFTRPYPQRLERLAGDVSASRERG